MKARRGGKPEWDPWKPKKQRIDYGPVLPTHPEILKRLRVEYPQTKDELTLCIAEQEAFFSEADAADYRSALQHLRSI